MRKNITIAFFILGISISFAQNIKRNYITIEQRKGFLEVDTNDGQYIIKQYSDKIIETTFVPNGEAVEKESHAVVLPASDKPFTINDTGYYIECQSGEGLSIMIYKKPFQISYYYKGKTIVSERLGYQETDTLQVLDFNLEPTESLYGGGARALGMNRRGNRLKLYNKAHYGYETKSELMNYTMPLVMSSKLYAIHFDNPTIGFLDLDSKKDNSLQYESVSGRNTYQVIVGDDWKDLVNQYTTLTGKQPLPPRWALGNFASRFGYHSEKQTRDVVAKFKKEKIPLDAVILDLYWFGKEMKGTMGNLEFHKDSFPDYKNMIADFNRDGIKTILITEPFILTTSGKWKEAVDKNILAVDKKSQPFTYDFYFGKTGLVDIFKPEGKEWFWNIYKKYTEEGVGGWWGDLGEPEVHPKELMHGRKKADHVHNIYGHTWAQLVAEGYKKDFPTQRPFILMRAGYSGSQRFGLIPWSGDVNRTWGGLQSQPEIALQMGMQGLGYMHSDLGGFAGENLDDELYTRWLQYGVFQPIFRPHAQEEVPSEPVFREPATKALAKKAIELRYSMMPYNYTLAYENNQNGLPLMRPLFFDETDNEELLTYTGAYMWGDSFLVSPVLEAKKTEQEVYFPKGNNWYDLTNETIHQGGQKKTIPVDINAIPVFIKGGSFVPMIEPIQNSRAYSTKDLTVHYFYDNSENHTTDKLYEDDGTTPNAVEEGKYEVLNFSGTLDSGSIEIVLQSVLGANYEGVSRNITLVLHGVQTKPRNIKVAGFNVPRNWDGKTKKLTITFTMSKGGQEKIRVIL